MVIVIGMISTLIFVLSIFQCGIVVSKASTLAPGNSSIPLSELIEELRRESYDIRLQHLSYIFLVESYGDHLYNLSKPVSAECAIIVKANSIMFEQLAICEPVDAETHEALAGIARGMENTTYVEEHPVELWCRSIFMRYSASEPLSKAFEKAKNEARKVNLVSGRPPYYSKVLKNDSMDSLAFKIVDKYTVPEFARLKAVASFLGTGQVRPTNSSCGCKTRRYIFAKACLAVAGQEKFAVSMQNIFAKVVNETIPDIGVADRHERKKASMVEGGDWWIPKMTKAMYSYIAKDPVLKTALENQAAIIGKNEAASPGDLDFSKL